MIYAFLKDKKYNLLGLLWFACTLFLLSSTANRTLDLPVSWIFFSPLSLKKALLNISLVCSVFYACIGVGRALLSRLELAGHDILALGIGIVVLNMAALPLFFLQLFNLPVLFLFFTVFFIFGQLGPLALLPQDRKKKRLLLVLFSVCSLPHLFNALLPVLFFESQTDALAYYHPVQLLFARHGGAFFDPSIVTALVKLCQYDVLVSVFMVLANPAIVKIVGLFLFMALALTMYHMAEEEAGGVAGLIAVFLLLSTFMLQDASIFSFTHERVLTLYLSVTIVHLMAQALRSGDHRWHLFVFMGLGVLAGTSMGAIIPIALTLSLVLFSRKLWRGHIGAHLLYAAVMGVVACCFPVWNYAHTGTLLPTAFLLNGKFAVAESLISPANLEMWNLYFSRAPVGLFDYLAYMWEYLYLEFGLSACLLVVGLWFAKRRTVAVLYFYAFAALAANMAIFKVVLNGGAYNRFLLVVEPFFILLIAVTAALLWHRFRAEAGARKAFCWFGAALLTILLCNAVRIFVTGARITDKMLMVVSLSSGSSASVKPFYVDRTQVRNFGFHTARPKNRYLKSYYVRVHSLKNSPAALNALFEPPPNDSGQMISSAVSETGTIMFMGFIVPKADLKDVLEIKTIIGAKEYVFDAGAIREQWEEKEKFNVAGREWGAYYWPVPSNTSVPVLALKAVGQASVELLRIFLGKRRKLELYPETLYYLVRAVNPVAAISYCGAEISAATTAMAEEVDYINHKLAANDRVLSLFFPPRTYFVAQVFHPVTNGAASAIYSKTDVREILAGLKTLGITHLYRNGGGMSDLNNYFELLSPLFAPEVFARYFIPETPSGFTHLLFRINYEGLSAEDAKANFRAVSATGFFQDNYEMLAKIPSKLKPLRHNPTQPQWLISEYRRLVVK